MDCNQLAAVTAQGFRAQSRVIAQSVTTDLDIRCSRTAIPNSELEESRRTVETADAIDKVEPRCQPAMPANASQLALGPSSAPIARDRSHSLIRSGQRQDSGRRRDFDRVLLINVS